MDQDQKIKNQERSARGGATARRSATEAAALLDQRIAGQRFDSLGSDDPKAKSKAQAAASVSTVKLEPPPRSSKKPAFQTTMEVGGQAKSDTRPAVPLPKDVFDTKREKTTPTDIRVEIAELEAQATGKSPRSSAASAETKRAERDAAVKNQSRNLTKAAGSSSSAGRNEVCDLESDVLSKSNSRDGEPAVALAKTLPGKEDPAIKKMRGAHSKVGGPSNGKHLAGGAVAVRDLDERIAYKTGIVAENHDWEIAQTPSLQPTTTVHEENEEDHTNDTMEKHVLSRDSLSKLIGLPPGSSGAALGKVQADQNENKVDSCMIGDAPPEGYPYGDLEGGDDLANKLAVAIAVKEDEGGTFIPAAVEYDPDAKPPIHRNRRFRLYSLLACTLITVMIAGVAGLLTQQKKEAPYQDDAPTTAPTRPGSNGILEQLELIVGSEVLNDPKGAHYRAKEWIINEDPLQLSSEDSNLIQRYLLAVVYFKLHEEGDWLSCNAPTEDDPDDFCLFQKLINIYPQEYRSIAWYRWLSGNHECSWAGLFCDEFFQLRTIDLVGQDISGTLPAELTFLPFLQGISLAWNKIHGTLPTDFGDMPHLLNFELHYNQLTGTISGEWARAKNLQLFNVAANEISGALPHEFGGMSNLKGLFLYENIMTGPFPEELTQLSLLTYARIQRNFFTGTIPSEVGLLSPRELWVHRMPLEGSLPPEIGDMGDILDLRLHETSINGTLPEEIWQLTKLFRLDLFNTEITGTLSPKVGQLTDLVFLRLRNTDMSGTIPTEIAALTELNKLWLDMCNFTGSVPDAICDQPGLEELVADCLPPSEGGDPLVNCTCCHGCCDYTTGLCELV